MFKCTLVGLEVKAVDCNPLCRNEHFVFYTQPLIIQTYHVQAHLMLAEGTAFLFNHRV